MTCVETAPSTPAPVKRLAPMRQLPLDLGRVQGQTLLDFTPGHNEAMLAWLSAGPAGWAPGLAGYLWGPPGCGKTHLLHGLATQALQQGWQVMWLAPRGFQTWDAAEPEAPTLVLIDECQGLDAQQQHWAFQLYIELAGQAGGSAAGPSASGAVSGGLAMVSAGRLPPIDLPLREDLRTRLGAGAVFAVEPLDDDGVCATLLRACQQRGLRVAEGVVPYVLTRFSRDLGSLMALVDRLDRYALAEQRAVTVPLLKQMLAQEPT